MLIELPDVVRAILRKLAADKRRACSELKEADRQKIAKFALENYVSCVQNVN